MGDEGGVGWGGVLAFFYYWPQVSVFMASHDAISIGTASDYSVEFRNYFDNVTLTSQKPCQHKNKCDCSKTSCYKWSLVSWVRCGTWLYRFLSFAPLLTLFFCCCFFFNKISLYSDILLKNTYTSFILPIKIFRVIIKMDLDRAEPTCYWTYFLMPVPANKQVRRGLAPYVHTRLDSIVELLPPRVTNLSIYCICKYIPHLKSNKQYNCISKVKNHKIFKIVQSGFIDSYELHR